MVKGTITDLKFNLMKDQLKKMFRESFPSIEKCPIKADDIFHTRHASWNYHEELYENDFTDDEECQQQETYLTSYPQQYLNRPSQSRQQEQHRYPTTIHREGHNNAHTNAPQNNSSHTKGKVKIPETKLIPLHAVQSVNL